MAAAVTLQEVEVLEAENAGMRASLDATREAGRQTEASKLMVFQGLDAQVLEVERKAQTFRRKHEQVQAFCSLVLCLDSLAAMRAFVH